MSARGWGSHSQTESHTKPPQGEKQGEWNITINLPTKPHTNPWSSPHRKSVFLMRSSITYPNRWVQSSEDPPNGRWSSGGSQRWWMYGARASHIASNQWAFITSSNTRNNLQSCGKRNGLPWKNTKHRELRSIARWSGWWHPWAISRPSWCSEKWVNEVDHTIQSLRCREAWRPISSRAESHTKPQKGEKQGALIVSPSISRQTTHATPSWGDSFGGIGRPIRTQYKTWPRHRLDLQENPQSLIKTRSHSNPMGAYPLCQHDNQYRPDHI